MTKEERHILADALENAWQICYGRELQVTLTPNWFLIYGIHPGTPEPERLDNEQMRMLTIGTMSRALDRLSLVFKRETQEAL